MPNPIIDLVALAALSTVALTAPASAAEQPAQPQAPAEKMQPSPAAPNTAPNAAPDVPLKKPLSEHLGQTGGVIKPPPTVDKGVQPPPNPSLDRDIVVSPPPVKAPVKPDEPHK